MSDDATRLRAALIAFLLIAGCVSPVKKPASDTAQAGADRAVLADSVVTNWQPQSRTAARVLIERYGVPDEIRPDAISWKANGQWTRTVVREITPPYVQSDDLGVIEQSVAYPQNLTNDEIIALADFDRHISYDRTSGELRARSDREEINYLRLNLANEIVAKRVTPRMAAALYSEALRLEEAGKTSPYLLRLRFGREPQL